MTLALNLPPGSTPEQNYVARADSGILEPVSWKQTQEYLYGGEYDERLEAIGEPSLTEEDLERESDVLWLPVSVDYEQAS